MNRLISTLNQIGLWGAILSLGLLVIIAMAEMLTRSIWGTSLGFATEFSGYLVAFSFFLGSGWALANDGHIRVDLLSDKLSKKNALHLDILATFVGFVISLLLLSGIFQWFLGTFERGSVSYYQTETPLWIPQLIFTLGPFILTCGFIGRLKNLMGKYSKETGQ